VLARDRIDHARTAAFRFLLERQSPDGAWRSVTYGLFKDGDALTPHVLLALCFARLPDDGLPALQKGAAYLAALARPDGTINEGPHGLSYPTYTAAFVATVLSEPIFSEHRQARDAWLAYLLERQLTEALGWQPGDRAFGGWGYAHSLPRKPRQTGWTSPGEPTDLLTESNLSATVCALEALRAAGLPPTDPVFGKALMFVCRCQNYAEDPDPEFDDGGFFFMRDDPLRNKAGVVGTDRSGLVRFASYGSVTSDGLRALIACGVSLADPRVGAARLWLERNFSVSLHPGQFAPGRALLRASIYYYYCWSLIRALHACGAEALTPDRVGALAEELLHRQRPDGSWVNEAVEVREDDPLVATPFALGTLACCERAVNR
jgi:squalene-hopene/tetraprenyl-beta-curcumene cyclase